LQQPNQLLTTNQRIFKAIQAVFLLSVTIFSFISAFIIWKLGITAQSQARSIGFGLCSLMVLLISFFLLIGCIIVARRVIIR
jgi:hypothetical protein